MDNLLILQSETQRSNNESEQSDGSDSDNFEMKTGGAKDVNRNELSGEQIVTSVNDNFKITGGEQPINDNASDASEASESESEGESEGEYEQEMETDGEESEADDQDAVESDGEGNDHQESESESEESEKHEPTDNQTGTNLVIARETQSESCQESEYSEEGSEEESSDEDEN